MTSRQLWRSGIVRMMSPLTGLGMVGSGGFYPDSAPHGAVNRHRCLAANSISMSVYQRGISGLTPVFRFMPVCMTFYCNLLVSIMFSSRFQRRRCSRQVGTRWFRGRGGGFRPGTDAFRHGSGPFRARRCGFRPGTRAFRPGTGRFRAGCGSISSGRRRFRGGTRGFRGFWRVVATQLRAGIDEGWDGATGTRRRPPVGLGGQELSCRAREKRHPRSDTNCG